MNKETGVTWKLGMFVITGILLFAAAIYFIGDQRNLFGSTFKISTVFSTVSGLKIGNNVRFAGINIGTVDEIELITDTSVRVDIIIRKEVRKFIRKDAVAGIASDGLMGDKVLTVYPGTTGGMVDENAIILARDPIEMDDIMISVKESVDNISLITDELAEFTYKLNNGKGALSKLMNDEKFGKSLDATMTNLKEGSKGLSENMEAAKSNFLLKGYFNKKKKEAAKKAEELKKQEELKKKKKTDTNN